jgi:CheY-like chemotaxis protein
VFDDNATNRRILTDVAARWGMLVGAATGGPEALEWLRQGQRFDIAVLDLHMPEMDGAELAREIHALPECADMPLVLLSSLGLREGVPASSRFAAFLTKPTKPAQLFETLCRHLRPDSSRTGSRQPFPDAPEPERPLRSEHVLLAEDNTVNQRVAVRMLETLGCEVTVVGNGASAVEAVASRRFDLVLMDCQMPVMDGLAATAAIRSAAGPHAGVPIVALTANAMSGDRQRCLEAGMDDYLPKPIDRTLLVETVRRWVGQRPATEVPGTMSV